MAVEEGGARAVMSSYQRIGAYWAGACAPLLTTVLRDEWGFSGTVVTDSANIGYANMHILSGIGAGNDMWLNTNADNYVVKDLTARPTLLNALRRASHRILFNVVNSSAMNGVSQTAEVVPVTPMWMTWLYIADAVVVLACAAGGALVIVRTVRNKKEDN